MSTTTETTIAEIRERQKARLQIADTMHEIFKIATRDVDFLLAKLDARVPVAVGESCTCNHVCPSRYEREIDDEVQCVHADWCALSDARTQPSPTDAARRAAEEVVANWTRLTWARDIDAVSEIVAIITRYMNLDALAVKRGEQEGK